MRFRWVNAVSWLLLLLLVVVTPNIVSAATQTSSLYLSPHSYQQANDNSGPISEVTFNGNSKDQLGFIAGEPVHIEVKNPAGESLICDTRVDQSGSWSCTVKLWKTNPVYGTYYYRIRGLTSGVSFTGSFNNEGTVQGIRLLMGDQEVDENGTVNSDAELDVKIIASSDSPQYLWSSTAYQMQNRQCTNGTDCNWQTVFTSRCLDQPTPDLKGKFSEKEVVFQNVLSKVELGAVYRLLFTTYTNTTCKISSSSQWYYTGQFTVVTNPTLTTLSCAPTPDVTGKTMVCEASVKRTVKSQSSPTGLVRFHIENAENNMQTPAYCILSDSSDGESACQTSFSSGQSGTFMLQAEYESDSNLDDNSISDWLPVTFSIQKPVLTITAGSQIKTYGRSDPFFSYSYIPSNAFVTISGTLERDPGEDAGDYTIRQGSLSAEDYEIRFIPSTLTIEKAKAVIQAAGYSGVYDGMSHGVSGNAAGVKGEDLSSLLSFGPVYTNVPGGVSSWSFKGNENYLPDENKNVPVAIFPREIEVTADALKKDYGDPDPQFTYSITGGNLVNDDVITGDLTREKGETAGLYFLDPGTLAVSRDYNLTFVSAWFKINKRPITVAADPQRKEVGQPDPALTYRITEGSLVGNDMFGGSIARSPGETVGAYGINQSSLYLSDNYELSFIPSTFAIYQSSDQLDQDFDGVLNAQDNCVFKSNADQADADDDGFGDVCDPTNNQMVAAMMVPVTGGSGLSDVNCMGETVFTLANGNHVTLPPSLCGMRAALSNEPQTSLPGELPQGFIFVSALNTALLQGETPQLVLPDGSSLIFGFALPSADPSQKSAVFYWDETHEQGLGGWVSIPSCLGLEPLSIHPGNNAETRKIEQCLSRIEKNGVRFSTNFTGLFVLVAVK